MGEPSTAELGKWVEEWASISEFADLLDEITADHPDLARALQEKWRESAAWCGVEPLARLMAGESRHQVLQEKPHEAEPGADLRTQVTRPSAVA